MVYAFETVGDAPTPEERALLKSRTAAALPPNLRAATERDLVGRWTSNGCGDDVLTFAEDGTWGEGTDPASRFVIGPHGSALATASGEYGCDNVDVSTWMERLARVGMDGEQAILLDVDGHELGRLTPSDDVRSPQ